MSFGADLRFHLHQISKGQTQKTTVKHPPQTKSTMTISAFKTRTVAATEEILKSGPDTIGTIEGVIASSFPFGADLSKVEEAFKTDLESNG